MTIVSDGDRDDRHDADTQAKTARGLTAAAAVDRMYAAARGRPPGRRPQHARGRVFAGSFAPSGDLMELTRARHFLEPSNILIRFSNGSPDPTTPDTEPGVRGMAVRFLENGRPVHDLVAANLFSFATHTPDGFIRLAEILGAINPAARGVGRLLNGLATAGRFVAFTLAHPESIRATREFGQLRAPASFATTRFSGTHAYWLVNERGVRTAFRYRIQPEAGELALDRDATATPRQFLISELEERLARGPVRFALIFQLADDGDPTSDPTRVWPSTRRDVVAGHVTISAVAPDAEALEQTVFDPTRVSDGVELSDDPVLRFRGYIYRLSAARRRAGG